ncbi:alpha/beta fold hydrolase [Nocardia otitidiscaviarum]|uniref:alpha/beta fold hydrolase n=1 Tax=Nocardia otitidiscaviarum TaxID=1823 RepID=UPI001895F378|nr:alpha/beta hydrolase [Nocardia otitidiscaviarum]MBF6181133.1 alpha/beta hydrolase [Nocardia otitidiscaviarum]
MRWQRKRSNADAALGYYRRGMARVRDAGFLEKQAEIDGYRINYAEGPAAGRPLLLIHGQGSRWQDYQRVLPELAEHHHVYVIDVPGHGGSARLPADEYTNAGVGARIARFIEEIIGAPALVSGHSSGGLLTTWLAAERPDLVRGVVLEDPPYYSSIMPRAALTTGGDMARVTREFLAQDSERDFTRYYVEHSRIFSFFGPLAGPITRYCVHYLRTRPGRPLEVFFLPPVLNIYFRGIADYDPVFGAAWYDNSWYRGFDTDTSLSAITAPAVLIHTNYWFRHRKSYYDKHGVLMAAMDDKDVARTLSHLPAATLVEVDSGHNVHFERPAVFLGAVGDLATALER